MRFVCTGARLGWAGTRKVRPGLPTGYRSVGSHTLPAGTAAPPRYSGSLAPAREQRLVAGCRDVSVSSAK